MRRDFLRWSLAGGVTLMQGCSPLSLLNGVVPSAAYQTVSNLQGAFNSVRDAMGEPAVSPRVVAAAWQAWLPGIPKDFDCQDLLAAMAPRPLLILGGDSDPVAPLEGAKEAFAVIEPAYKRAGAADRLQILIAEHSGHTVTPAQQQAMYAWFERWLKP